MGVSRERICILILAHPPGPTHLHQYDGTVAVGKGCCVDGQTARFSAQGDNVYHSRRDSGGIIHYGLGKVILHQICREGRVLILGIDEWCN